MLIKVLGSAAGGGFPQINCNCRNCADLRRGRPGLSARTQSSLAVTRDGENWVLLNASPDLGQQIRDNAPDRHDMTKLIAASEQGRRDIAQLLAAEAASASKIDVA